MLYKHRQTDTRMHTHNTLQCLACSLFNVDQADRAYRDIQPLGFPRRALGTRCRFSLQSRDDRNSDHWSVGPIKKNLIEFCQHSISFQLSQTLVQSVVSQPNLANFATSANAEWLFYVAHSHLVARRSVWVVGVALAGLAPVPACHVPGVGCAAVTVLTNHVGEAVALAAAAIAVALICRRAAGGVAAQTVADAL